jgi:hypothetical protein
MESKYLGVSKAIFLYHLSIEQICFKKILSLRTMTFKNSEAQTRRHTLQCGEQNPGVRRLLLTATEAA